MKFIYVLKMEVNKKYGYCQKRTLWYSYVLHDKMRTNYSWKAVEPILEMRKIGETYQRVVLPTTQHNVHFWNPDPLFVPLDSLKRMICIQSAGLGSSQKIFSLFNPSNQYHASFLFQKWAYSASNHHYF